MAVGTRPLRGPSLSSRVSSPEVLPCSHSAAALTQLWRASCSRSRLCSCRRRRASRAAAQRSSRGLAAAAASHAADLSQGNAHASQRSARATTEDHNRSSLSRESWTDGCLSVLCARRPLRTDGAIVMAVPKKRQSKMKTRQRKANVRTAPQLRLTAASR